MEEFFAARSASNDRVMCIGPLSKSESNEAVEMGLGDGTGLYLFLTEASQGGKVIEVLAKLASDEAGRMLSGLFGFDPVPAV